MPLSYRTLWLSDIHLGSLKILRWERDSVVVDSEFDSTPLAA